MTLSFTRRTLVNQLRVPKAERVFRSLGFRGSLMCMISAYVHSTSQGACTFTNTSLSSETWRNNRNQTTIFTILKHRCFPHYAPVGFKIKIYVQRTPAKGKIISDLQMIIHFLLKENSLVWIKKHRISNFLNIYFFKFYLCVHVCMWNCAGGPPWSRSYRQTFWE